MVQQDQQAHPATISDGDSSLGENGEVCQLSESTEDFSGQQLRPRMRSRGLDSTGEERPKSVVDPRKYKTKLCRNWKAHGHCPYEHTCCYAHGDLETRTVHQNNNVLSSLGYFSGMMLLAMKEEQQGGKGTHASKRLPAKALAALALKQNATAPRSEPPAPSNAIPEPNTPTVHSPYCLPEGPNFGTESNPSSPLGIEDAQMPPYSFRTEAGKTLSVGPAYGPFPDPMSPYDPEYYIPMNSTYPSYMPFPAMAMPIPLIPIYPVYDNQAGFDGYTSYPHILVEPRQEAA